MKKLVLIFLLISSFAYSQEQDKKMFFTDIVVGPYLFVHHHDYKSVFLTGVRLGYEFSPKMAFALEYLAGQQHDVYDELGTTHTANGQLSYFVLPSNKGRFNPYIHLGGGFFEFKDFKNDVLGVAWNTGGGSELNVSKNIKAFIEARYVNLGWLNLGGKNELGVLWGIRAKF